MFAKDSSKRQGHLIQNPFKQINEFRFDAGWKALNELGNN